MYTKESITSAGDTVSNSTKRDCEKVKRRREVRKTRDGMNMTGWNDKSKDGMADGSFSLAALAAHWMAGRPGSPADGCTAVCRWGLARPTWRQCSLETPAPEGA